MSRRIRTWGIAVRLLLAACATAAIASAQGNITCSSNDGGRHYCSAPNGSVRMLRQRSGSPCVRGRTWGSDANGIWVDRGCRADFAIEPGRGRYNNGYYNDGRANDRSDRDRDDHRRRDDDRNRSDRDHDHDRDRDHDRDHDDNR